MFYFPQILLLTVTFLKRFSVVTFNGQCHQKVEPDMHTWMESIWSKVNAVNLRSASRKCFRIFRADLSPKAPDKRAGISPNYRIFYTKEKPECTVGAALQYSQCSVSYCVFQCLSFRHLIIMADLLSSSLCWGLMIGPVWLPIWWEISL